MLKQLRILAATVFLALGFAGTGFAQYSLYVNGPAPLVGRVAGTATPAGTGWGFGDFNTAFTPPIRGFAAYSAIDTVGLDTSADYSSVKGKIAVFYRITTPTNFFAQKAYCAQKGGAIGIIIINHSSAAIGNMGTSVLTPRVTIPMIYAPLSWEAKVRSAIIAGTLDVSIGNAKGAFPYNLSLLVDQVTPPTPLHIPNFMIKNSKPGELTFPVGGFLINAGNRAQQDVHFSAQIERIDPSPAVIWKDSAIVGNIAAAGTKGDTAFDGNYFDNFDFYSLTNGGTVDPAGHYRLTYLATSTNKDTIPDDNSVVYDFYVNTVGAWSRTKLKVDSNYKPITQGSTTRAAGAGGDQSIKWGQMLKTGTAPVGINALTYGTSTINALIAGEQVSIEVQKWDDANVDGAVTDDELTLVGTAARGFTDEAERGVFFTDSIADANTTKTGVLLEPNTHYAILWTYSGTTVMTVNTDNINFRRYAALDTARNYFAVLNVAPSWYYGFTGFNVTPAFRVNLYDPANPIIATKPTLANQVGMRVFPNPATDQVQVNVTDAIAAGKATIQITDLAGRVMVEESHALQSGVSHYKLSTASLNNGIYNVRVSTDRGSKTQKLVIAK